MSKQIVLMQLVGSRIGEAVVDAIVDCVKCSEAEREWLAFSIGSAIKTQSAALKHAAKSNGVELPSDIVPKDYLSYEEVSHISGVIISGLLAVKDQSLGAAEKLSELSMKAFGVTTPDAQLRLLKDVFATAERIDPANVANELFERHLKLVH